MKTTKKEVERWFKTLSHDMDKKDKPAMREAWNNFTDMLCKDGKITYKQYMTWSHPVFIK